MADNKQTTEQSNMEYVVPTKLSQRERVRDAAYEYVQAQDISAPVAANLLQEYAENLLIDNHLPNEWLKYTAIMISNAVWHDTVADIPYNRRILFLPRCMSNPEACQADVDEYGMICRECGSCDIGRLQSKAEDLGYAVLVAEGAAMVTQMLMNGNVDAVIGVSCLSVLEKAFPFMAAGGIPGIALPLLGDGCSGTSFDTEWLETYVTLKSEKTFTGQTVELDSLRKHVAEWFSTEALNAIMLPGKTHTEEIGINYLSRGGKRWRPLLAASAFEALTAIRPSGDQRIQTLAVAVECFHKASLIHDDIEDDDDIRYGVPSLHVEQGMPVALNAGDYLIGEGYRLIAECGGAPTEIVRMLLAASQGHRDLSLGQGEELWWTHSPGPISVNQVLDIFRLKTAPAFDVAIKIGAICGGADEELCHILDAFSDDLGIAYQIQDDLDDFLNPDMLNDIDAMRPSLLLALCYLKCNAELRGKMETAWKIHRSFKGLSKDLHDEIDVLDIPAAASEMLNTYRANALEKLDALKAQGLKQLLVNLTHQILPIV